MTNVVPVIVAVLFTLSLPATVLGAGTAPVSADATNAFESTTQPLTDDLLVTAVPSDATGSTNTDGMEVIGQSVQEDNVSSDPDRHNTTNRIGLTGEVRNEYVTHSADFGTALKVADDELRVDHDTYALLDRGYENATSEQRQVAIDRTYDRLADRIDSLEQRERNAVQAHAAGAYSTTLLLQTILRNHNSANNLEDSIDTLADRADTVPGYSMPSAADDDDGRLALHHGPIRSELDTVSIGEPMDESYQPYLLVQTSETGYTLSMIDGTYVFETTRFDNRDTEEPTQFADTIDAYEHVQMLYPWAFEHGQSPLFHEHTHAQLYNIQLSHEQGDLVGYLDGGTGEIHREEQHLIVSTLPWFETNQTYHGDGLIMSVNTTPYDGPMEVTVTDAQTGAPTSATISIDEFELGTTDDDGTLWVLPPIGAYELSASNSAGTVNATVTQE